MFKPKNQSPLSVEMISKEKELKRICYEGTREEGQAALDAYNAEVRKLGLVAREQVATIEEFLK